MMKAAPPAPRFKMAQNDAPKPAMKAAEVTKRPLMASLDDLEDLC